MYHAGTQYTSKAHMADPSLPPLLIIADAPDALTELGGISLLERMRRTARQLGFREATILSNSIESVRQHMAKQSWRKEDVSLKFQRHEAPRIAVADILEGLPVNEGRFLILFANFYCDVR